MNEDNIDKFLSFITTYGYAVDNSTFLQELSKFLTDVLKVNYAIIDKYSINKPGIAEIECFYSKKEKYFYPKKSYDLKNTPCENVINKSVCSFNNVAQQFPKDKLLIDQKIESYVGVPLWSINGQPIGLLAVMDNNPINDDKEISKLLQIVGLKVEKILEKIIYIGEIEYKNKVLEESELNLWETQKIAKLGSFSLNVMDGTWECNSILEEIIGIDSSFVKNMEGILSIVHPDDRETVSVDIFDIINDKIFAYNKEYRIIRNNNKERRWVNTLGKIILDSEGNPFQIVGTMQDITSSKRILEELTIAKLAAEESENKLIEAQKIAELGSYSFNIITGLWESCYILDEIFGIDTEFEKTTESWIQLIHPEDRAMMATYLENNIVKNHEFFDKEYRIVRRQDNAVRWVHGYGKLTFDAHNNPIKLFGTIQDITKSKNTQEELQKAKRIAEENEHKFKSLIQQAGDALYLHDLEGKILEVNNTSVLNSGYSREELLTMEVRNLDVVHPDLKILRGVWDNLTTESPVTIESFHKRKNGTIYPIEIRISAIYINEEKLIYGFARDISERITLHNENKLLSTAVDQSANSIVITNIKGNIEFVNPKFTQVTGYSSDEVIGKNPRLLNSGTLPKDYYKNLWDTILKGETWTGEFQNKTKLGTLIWEHTTITPIKNEQGIITNFLAIKENITERMKSEKELTTAYSKIKESEDYLRQILQTANEGFWIIGPTGITTDVNLKMCDILGFSRKEFISTSIFDFVDDESAHIFRNQIKLRDKGLSTNYEIDLKKKDGSKATCLFKTSPIFNNVNERIGSFALVTDVTNLKEASNKLKVRNKELNELSMELFDNNKLLNESKNRYASLFNQSPISILEEDFSEVIKLVKRKNLSPDKLKIYLDENLDFLIELIQSINILKTNTACLQLFGVKSRLELIDHLHKTNNENSYKVLKNEILAVVNGEDEFITESVFENTKGEKINVFVKLAILDKQGKAISTIIDISNLKNTEIELRFAKEKAEESNRLKAEFLNNMSHEIRTPMNGILGFSELLSNSELSQSKRNYFVSIIQNSGKQLLNVIDDILEISRLGTKQVKVVETEVCLNDLLLELFSIFDLKAKENGVPLYVKNQLSDCESTIYSDRLKLQKIVGNLLENALKFTSSGYVSFGYNLVGESIEIFVKDTGIGIKNEKLDVIFDRFSQEEKDLSRNASGLGLGLSIAKENTKLLGGKISVESVKWEGSTFKVRIPYKHVENSDKKAQLSLKDVKIRTKYKVLVVEDEEVNYLFIEILLVDKINLNCDILHAKNGLEAVELCSEHNDIDIILMDINMPIMNGYEATQKIKALYPSIPIIVQTAYSTPEDKAKAMESGCDDFISKPLNKDQLKLIIESHLVEIII